MKMTSELPEKQRTAMTMASGIATSGSQAPTQPKLSLSVTDDLVPNLLGSNVTSSPTSEYSVLWISSTTKSRLVLVVKL